MPAADEELRRDLDRLCRLGVEEVRIDSGAGGDGRRLIAAIAGPASGDLDDRLGEAFERLRRRSSREALLREHGCDLGFRIEDLLALTVGVSGADSAATALGWLRRRLPREAALAAVDSGGAGALHLAAAFVERAGRSPSRERYAVGGDGRVRVEAFELHVVEHCNLRCANCCNMSPLVPERTHERPYAFAAALVDLRLAEIGAAAGPPDRVADRAPDPATARSALEAAFRDLPFLRAYLPGAAERAAAISAHQALVAGRPAPAPFALHAIDTIFSAEELRAVARAVACYRSQVIDLFGADDAPAIARAYAAA